MIFTEVRSGSTCLNHFKLIISEKECEYKCMKKGGKCDERVRENKRKFQDVEESESKKIREEKMRKEKEQASEKELK